MKFTQAILIVLAFSLVAAGCQKVTLKQEVPSYPAAADQVLPK